MPGGELVPRSFQSSMPAMFDPARRQRREMATRTSMGLEQLEHTAILDRIEGDYIEAAAQNRLVADQRVGERAWNMMDNPVTAVLVRSTVEDYAHARSAAWRRHWG